MVTDRIISLSSNKFTPVQKRAQLFTEASIIRGIRIDHPPLWHISATARDASAHENQAVYLIGSISCAIRLDSAYRYGQHYAAITPTCNYEHTNTFPFPNGMTLAIMAADRRC